MWYVVLAKGETLPLPKTMEMIEKLRPDLVERARTMREEGNSIDAIGRMFSAEVGTSVGREIVRKWLDQRGITKPPKESETEVTEPV